MDKQTTVEQAVNQLTDGMTVGIGGWGSRRKPMGLVRAICRSPLKDLTIVSYGGPDVGMLCASGKVRKLIFGFVSLDVIALDPHFRAARESGSIEVSEYDEGMLQWGLYAAGLRLPFLPTHVGLGTDVERLTGELRSIESPYGDGARLLAMPAIELDVALVHVDQADNSGNGQVLGSDPYFDDLFCQAARHRIASCERIVATGQLLNDGCVHSLRMNRTMLDNVVEVPRGAHPTSCPPEYGMDEQHLREYASARDERSWTEYRQRYIDCAEDKYVEAVAGPDRVAARAPSPSSPGGPS